MSESSLTAVALVCSLKPSPAPSSSQLIAEHLLAALQPHGVTGEVVRVVDHDVKPGVEKDMGNGDQWPAIRDKVLAADILILSTPTWMGHTSSVAQRVQERLDAELAETDDDGRLSAVTAAELVAGPLLAHSTTERAKRQARLQEVESTLEPLPFDSTAARSYGLVVAAVVAEGRKPRSRFADLLIAATAHANGLDLYSRNAADFAGLADLIHIVSI